MARQSKSTLSVEGIDIQQALDNVRNQLDQDDVISPAMRASIDMLILVVSLLANRFNLNSRNSSKPPASDPNRVKSPRRKSGKKPGGQPGHRGSTLQPYDDPDFVEPLVIDRRTLPKGQYRDAGFEARQVVDIDICRIVTEYRAQVLISDSGQRYVAAFPESITRPIQYGHQIKAHSVYLSQFQLLPYQRIQDYFQDQLGIPLSTGSIVNFNLEAAARVVDSGAAGIIRQRLQQGPVLHADETGININATRHWLHCASTPLWTQYSSHRKRGTEAMVDAGVIPAFYGVLCHDHWKPYYTYDQCKHALCNAHHLRELERAWEQDNQQWASKMQKLLTNINQAVDAAGGALSPEQGRRFRKQYRRILVQGDIESPPPDEQQRTPGKRGRLKRTKSRGLLERLRQFEDDVLRFMVVSEVPFTNNLGENDIRMTKVQQKISGCFRSMEGAETFCLVRGYLSTCRKHQLSASEALKALYDGKLPSLFSESAE
ncbi:MAG: IS66 family transposase [Gammaproteobacteria bacterium]|nr:IS66 family transposase [Gammaproteobacteria bacterium]MCP4876293.1 IS66 family transposase [Gammaproteobacteria bacterium]